LLLCRLCVCWSPLSCSSAGCWGGSAGNRRGRRVGVTDAKGGRRTFCLELLHASHSTLYVLSCPRVVLDGYVFSKRRYE
jgi:hypothetical protein